MSESKRPRGKYKTTNWKACNAALKTRVARMQAAPRFFNQEEWDALASYDGPILSGNAEGKIPADLTNDDNE